MRLQRGKGRLVHVDKRISHCKELSLAFFIAAHREDNIAEATRLLFRPNSCGVHLVEDKTLS